MVQLKDLKDKKKEEPQEAPPQEPHAPPTPDMQDWDNPGVRTSTFEKMKKPQERQRELTETEDKGDA